LEYNMPETKNYMYTYTNGSYTAEELYELKKWIEENNVFSLTVNTDDDFANIIIFDDEQVEDVIAFKLKFRLF